MTLYIGVDLHPHQQTAAWCDTQTGETDMVELHHDLEKVREFYSSFDQPAIVGIEASSRAGWFENMFDSTEHTLLVGDAYKIRKRSESRHKNDRLDAELILNLLMDGKFPAIWRRSKEQNQILDTLRVRLKLVGHRTAIYNRLQSLAHSVGLPKGSRHGRGRRSSARDSVRTAGELQPAYRRTGAVA